VDRFAIKVKAGQRVSFEAVGNRFGKEVDPLVSNLTGRRDGRRGPGNRHSLRLAKEISAFAGTTTPAGVNRRAVL
jgi:hypothetical protein